MKTTNILFAILVALTLFVAIKLYHNTQVVEQVTEILR